MSSLVYLSRHRPQEPIESNPRGKRFTCFLEKSRVVFDQKAMFDFKVPWEGLHEPTKLNLTPPPSASKQAVHRPPPAPGGPVLLHRCFRTEAFRCRAAMEPLETLLGRWKTHTLRDRKPWDLEQIPVHPRQTIRNQGFVWSMVFVFGTTGYQPHWLPAIAATGCLHMFDVQVLAVFRGVHELQDDVLSECSRHYHQLVIRIMSVMHQHIIRIITISEVNHLHPTRPCWVI